MYNHRTVMGVNVHSQRILIEFSCITHSCQKVMYAEEVAPGPEPEARLRLNVYAYRPERTYVCCRKKLHEVHANLFRMI